MFLKKFPLRQVFSDQFRFFASTDHFSNFKLVGKKIEKFIKLKKIRKILRKILKVKRMKRFQESEKNFRKNS